MPRCPAKADKATRLAWEREHELVRKGQGTRDWTPEQQKDILEYGKAYDDEGKAFEGQHMKSAAEYPEYQDDPDNIQFLSRKEHLEAHNGNWQNPTNWYYDPVEKQFMDFGDGAPTPCAVIDLSNPIVPIENYNEDTVADEIEPAENELNSGTDSPHADTTQAVETTNICTAETNSHSDQFSKQTILGNIKGIATVVKDFSEKHPVATAVVKVGIGLATAYGTSKAMGSLSKTDYSRPPGCIALPSQPTETVGKVIVDTATSLDFKNPESLLKKFGYAVAKRIGLTDMERQKILQNIITKGIMSKEAVCKCLENFINLHKSQNSFAEAVSKWTADLSFVQETL